MKSSDRNSLQVSFSLRFTLMSKELLTHSSTFSTLMKQVTVMRAQTSAPARDAFDLRSLKFDSSLHYNCCSRRQDVSLVSSFLSNFQKTYSAYHEC